MTQRFSLKWIDFETNVSRTFSQLRSEEEFFDVSLVSDDQKTMSAHKLVLSASSPYFRQILTHNKHSHPLLCLDGVSSGELQCVLDYIYQGEVEVHQDQLDRFLEVAQRFQLEGLRPGDPKEEPYQIDFHNRNYKCDEKPRQRKSDESTETKTQKRRITEDFAIVTLDGDTNIAEVDAKIDEYVRKSDDGTYTCGQCGKSGVKLKGDIKRHIETHIGGLSFPCQSCDKTFRSRASLSFHKSRYHRL